MKYILYLGIFYTLVSCASRPVVMEQSSNDGAERILDLSSSMIANQEIVIGGCWDYINTVYDRAGYSSNRRLTAFKSKFKGPYYNSDKIKPGDWLYFVNHSYRDIEHSAIFVRWVDKDKKIALMVNYLGENKRVPATYKEFHIDKVYNVIRPRDS